MEGAWRAIEVGATIDEQRELHLDGPLPAVRPGRARVIVLVPEDGEPDEAEWLKMAATNPAFAFLRDPEEDIYTAADGRPFDDQG